jgi:ectoine hydroxylase-related dioxygenase (phytanoyl-CoA dioxygenase family)
MHNEIDQSLTKEEIDCFWEAGWATKKALFGIDEVRQIQACFDNLEKIADDLDGTGPCNGSHFVIDGRNGAQVIKRVVWAGGSQPYLLNVGQDPRLTVPCSQLLGSNKLDQLLSQAHFKRPGDGVVFGWHQDVQHRDKGDGTWTDVNGTGSFVQTLIVIDRMTADSGPLQFIPGSSKWGRVNFGDHDYDNPGYEVADPAQFRAEEAVTILAEPGDTLFFGPFTAHASFENTSQLYRRVFINGYAYPGANRRQYPGDGAGRTIIVN